MNDDTTRIARKVMPARRKPEAPTSTFKRVSLADAELWLSEHDARTTAGVTVAVQACPKCGRAMQERKPGSPEQAFCGTWFDCPNNIGSATERCGVSMCVPSRGMLVQQLEMVRRSGTAQQPTLFA